MSVSNKIKGLLRLRNKKGIEYTNALGLVSASALNMKYVRESFKAQDLIILANLTGTKLAFIDENNNPIIIFDENDIKKKPTPKYEMNPVIWTPK